MFGYKTQNNASQGRKTFRHSACCCRYTVQLYLSRITSQYCTYLLRVEAGDKVWWWNPAGCISAIRNNSDELRYSVCCECTLLINTSKYLICICHLMWIKIHKVIIIITDYINQVNNTKMVRTFHQVSHNNLYNLTYPAEYNLQAMSGTILTKYLYKRISLHFKRQEEEKIPINPVSNEFHILHVSGNVQSNQFSNFFFS